MNAPGDMHRFFGLTEHKATYDCADNACVGVLFRLEGASLRGCGKENRDLVLPTTLDVVKLEGEKYWHSFVCTRTACGAPTAMISG